MPQSGGASVGHCWREEGSGAEGGRRCWSRSVDISGCLSCVCGGPDAGLLDEPEGSRGWLRVCNFHEETPMQYLRSGQAESAGCLRDCDSDVVTFTGGNEVSSHVAVFTIKIGSVDPYLRSPLPIDHQLGCPGRSTPVTIPIASLSYPLIIPTPSYRSLRLLLLSPSSSSTA